MGKPEVPLVLTPPLLVALGISPTLTVSVNPKLNWSTSSSKVSLKSSNGNKNWKPVKTSMLNGTLLPSQPSSKLTSHFDTFCVNNKDLGLSKKVFNVLKKIFE